MAEMIDRFCAQESRHLHKFLLDDLRAAANARDNPKVYMDALNVLMPAMLARGAKPREAMVKEGTPGSMLLSALQCAEGPEDLREVSLTLLTTLWSAFPDEIEIKGEECRQVINCLKKAARAPGPGDADPLARVHVSAPPLVHIRVQRLLPPWCTRRSFSCSSST